MVIDGSARPGLPVMRESGGRRVTPDIALCVEPRILLARPARLELATSWFVVRRVRLDSMVFVRVWLGFVWSPRGVREELVHTDVRFDRSTPPRSLDRR